jgi:hypothetical protein
VISIGRIVFLVAAVVLAAGLFFQVFLAGLGVFAGPGNFATHRDTGYTLTIVPVVLIVSGLAGRVGRRLVLTSVVILVLFILQSVFVAFRQSNPSIAALHPVNGFLILLVAVVLARDSWGMRTSVA